MKGKQPMFSDDINIGFEIIDKGYKVVNTNIPYYPIGLAKEPRQLFKQKRRTAMALMNSRVNFVKFYIHMFGYYISNFWKYKIIDHIALWYWFCIYVYSFIRAIPHQRAGSPDTEIWQKYERNVAR